MTLIRIFFCLSILILVTSAEFNPDVRWTCGQDFVSIFVRTDQPFEGSIVPRGTDSDDCLVHGDGANVAALKLSLADGKCGVVFDQTEDAFRLTVDIRSHPVLIVENDKTVNITCRQRLQKKKSTGDYFLEVFDGNLTTSHLRYAGEYRLRVSGTLKQNFTVGTCSANAGGNSTVQLTDRRGCSLLPTLLSDFKNQDSAMSASLPSMFRFPNSNTVTLSCRITACDGFCEDVDCSKPDNTVAALLDRTTVPMEVEEEGGTLVSLTITVVEKVHPEVVKVGGLIGKDGTVQTPTAEPQCARPADMDMLYGLCVVLTVCSALFLTINVFFCCVLWRRKKLKPQQKSLIQQSNTTDFWIMEQKPVPQPEVPQIDERRISTVSYASVKQKPRRAQIPVLDYAHPASRASDSSSNYSGSHYRRPDQSVRLSNSTFMTPSVTMETDLDSSISSNQTSSYH